MCIASTNILGKFKIILIVEFAQRVTYLTDNVTQPLGSTEFGFLSTLSQGKLKCAWVTIAIVTVPEGKLRYLGSK